MDIKGLIGALEFMRVRASVAVASDKEEVRITSRLYIVECDVNIPMPYLNVVSYLTAKEAEDVTEVFNDYMKFIRDPLDFYNDMATGFMHKIITPSIGRQRHPRKRMSKNYCTFRTFEINNGYRRKAGD